MMEITVDSVTKLGSGGVESSQSLVTSDAEGKKKKKKAGGGGVMGEEAETVVVNGNNTGVEEEEEKKGMKEVRAEIDTSAPFESVKEAVTRFGGSAVWRPHRTLQFGLQHSLEEFDVKKIKEEAAVLEKDLMLKERETFEVLKELEATKKNVEELKSKLQKEASEITITSGSDVQELKKETIVEEREIQNADNDAGSIEKLGEGFSLCPTSSPGLILMELKQAKMNLSRTTDDIAGIRASVESLNKKIAKERISVKKTRERLICNSAKISSLEEELNQTKQKLLMVKESEIKGGSENPFDISRELQQLNSEAERFKKMAEAAKSEVFKAMSEIEQTKTSIKTAEIRWIAAKKMAEAAKAAEAAALADIKALSKAESSSGVFQQQPEGITLTFEEYSSLTSKARDAEELSKKRVLDVMLQIDDANVSKKDILKKVEEATEEVRSSKHALEEALKRVESANRGKLAVEESLRKWRSEHGQRRRSMHKSSTKFKNSCPSHHKKESRLLDVNGMDLVSDDSKPALRPTLSIGQILSRKLLMPSEFDDVDMLLEDSGEKPKVSLGQMLGKKNGALSPPTTFEKEGNDNKQFSAKRKKFGITRFSILLARQNKKKKQAHIPRWVSCKGRL